MKLINKTKFDLEIIVGMRHEEEPTMFGKLKVGESVEIPEEDLLIIK